MTESRDASLSSPPAPGVGSSGPVPLSAALQPHGERGAREGEHEALAVGCAAFIGVGPGDPGLLTLRAAELLAGADVVVLDRASSGSAPDPALAAVRRHSSSSVQVLLADDEASHQAPSQAPTAGARGQRGTRGPAASPSASLVTSSALAGRRVVRVLAGDVASNAHFSAELAAVRGAGVPCEVVPGVSAATAVPLYAGVSTTSTDASDVHVLDASTTEEALDVVARAGGTVVLTGGPDDIVGSAKALVASGRPGAQEIVVTSAGTTSAQRTLSATLTTLADVLACSGEDFAEPLVAVVGPGTAAREQLAWFENRPLFGWRVLVPRTQAQSSPAVTRLAAAGATAEVVPTIAVEPPRTPHQMEKAVRGLVTGRYEWVAFTSVNAVRAVKDKFTEYGLDARAFSGLKVAAVGGVTAQALRDWGIEPDLVPAGESSASGLLAEWPPYDEILDPIDRVFLPRADIATETLVEGLTGIGWQVDDVTAYRTVRAAPPPAPVRDAIKSGAFDAVVFTSSSTVRNLVGIAGKPHPATVVACIGPATAATAAELGLRVDVQAPEATIASLVDELAAYGTRLREAAVAAGEPVRRPSQRRTGARRRR